MGVGVNLRCIDIQFSCFGRTTYTIMTAPFSRIRGAFDQYWKSSYAEVVALQFLHANTYTERRRPQPWFTHSPKRHKHFDGGAIRCGVVGVGGGGGGSHGGGMQASMAGDPRRQ